MNKHAVKRIHGWGLGATRPDRPTAGRALTRASTETSVFHAVIMHKYASQEAQ